MEIKLKPGITSPIIEKTLTNDLEFNEFINDTVYNPKNWVIYASEKYFKEDRISEYRGIKIEYMPFVPSATIAILYKI